MNRKNILLTIGSISSAILPVAAVISCGVNNPTQQDVDNKYKLESSRMMNRVQEQYWWEVFKVEQTGLTGEITDIESLWKVDVVKEMVDFTIKNNLQGDNKYLITLAAKYMPTEAMKEALSEYNKHNPIVASTHDLANKWNMLKFKDTPEIDGADALAEGAKKFLLKNDSSFRTQVLKSSISYLYLNKKRDKASYKEVFFKDDQKFTDVQELFEADDFTLINEAVKQHLFAKWQISLDKNNSLTHLSSTVSATQLSQADADTAMKTGWTNEMKYSDTFKVIPSSTLPVNTYDTVKGFSGVTQVTGNRGILKFDVDGFKSTNKESWNGYLDEIIKHDHIDMFKDGKSIVSLTRVFGFMPIWSATDNFVTFKGSYFESADERKALVRALSKSSGTYSEAEKFFSTRKQSPIQLEIQNEDLRNVAIDHGFKFIKED